MRVAYLSILVLALILVVVQGEATALNQEDVAGNQAAIPASVQASIDGGMATAIGLALHDAEVLPHSGVGKHINQYRVVATRSSGLIIVSLFPGLELGRGHSPCRGLSPICYSVTYTMNSTGQRIIDRHLWAD